MAGTSLATVLLTCGDGSEHLFLHAPSPPVLARPEKPWSFLGFRANRPYPSLFVSGTATEFSSVSSSNRSQRVLQQVIAALTAESLILQPKWLPLFDENVRERARARLAHFPPRGLG
jgi:hypothetical protein